ncbi:16267_t:CDS:2, partial [Gigaspora rosea]
KKVLLLVDNAASHMTSGTNNTPEVQDNDEELSSENDSEGTEEPQEPQQRRSRGRSRGRSQGSQRSNPTRSSQPRTVESLNLTNIVVHFLPPATRIMPEISGSEESESDNEFQDETTNVDDATMLLEDLSAETNPTVQELTDNIEEYIQMIDEPAATEDVLTDEGIIEMAAEALEKVIRYQESLDVGNGFDENGLIILRKKFKEWRYEKDKAKKQTSIISFFQQS